MNETESFGIAIIGLTGRFPGAANIEAFWQLLKNGQEAVTTFTNEELFAAGVDPDLFNHPNYVKAGTVISDVDKFDAGFFEMSSRDAEIADPQQRLLMESAWLALEQAGYPPATTEGRIGLYAGVGENHYLRHYLEPHRTELAATVGEYRLSILNDKDFLATHIAYKLNLTGPAVTVQTACSTSLVAVHIACQSLLNFECDMALAGGVSIFLPQHQGYLYQDGMILSPDGHCRAFDAQAQGTVFGSGVGVVLLKRLDEALRDGDTIHGVILGSAINNDGADKIGYTAPSVRGQTDVILEAQGAADIHPDEISYVEAHGTGTPLGDPIEIQALTQAFQVNTQRTGYCAIGSVKTNMGHADAAAGIAGLIKTVLALKHGQIPPSLHFHQPNPQIDFANSPFFVNQQLQDWQVAENTRRCAGVSSFGIGGTNAHVIMAEAPTIEPSSSSRPVQLMTVSAKTATALDPATENLAHWLQQHPDSSLADVAYTLNRGRQPFAYRRTFVCKNSTEAVKQLTQPDLPYHHLTTETDPEIVFLFPGQGSQYLNMTGGLYQTEPVFQEALDHCSTLLQPHLGQDIRHLLYSDDKQDEQHGVQLKQTGLTQPILFAVEYALATLWMAWGIQPKAMLGHSIGEYVAACLAGVFSLEDGLTLIATRGKLIQSLPSGAMLGVKLSEEALQDWLTPDLSLAVVNGVERCVVSGSHEAITTLQQKLELQGIDCRNLETSHGFHSHLMEPILAPFAQQIQQIPLHPPTIPYLSNVTGTWIAPEQATNPDYWVRHLRQTVRFRDNLQALFQQETNIVLEVGPGQTLFTLTQQHPDKPSQLTPLYSLPRRRVTENHAEIQQILSTLGQLWTRGVAVNWEEFYGDEKGHRLPLPTYPFERQKYWIKSTQSITQKLPETVNHSVVKPTGSQIKTISLTDTQPRLSSLEQEIAEIWSQYLGIAEIATDTDFFEVGGDSLLATQLVAGLRTQFQVDLDAHSLLKAPTVAQLATLISNHKTQPENLPSLPNLVVEIQEGNPKQKPLILMHPVGGHVYFYRELVRHLDSELPVYGIRAQGVEGEAEPLTNLTEMAQVYTAALQVVQPHGPYCLGGASFGGTLAFAMAQQLIYQGETVDFLALIDTPSPGNMPTDLDETGDILFYLLTVGNRVEIDHQIFQAWDEQQQLDFYLKHIVETRMTPEELQTMLKLFKANLRAMRNYEPPSYPGKLHFFLAKERDKYNAQTPANGWINLAEQGIEIYGIPGNHITMNQEPHVQQLATYLQQCLR